MLAKAKLALAQVVQVAVEQALSRLLPVMQRQSTDSLQALSESLAATEHRMIAAIANLAEGVTETERRMAGNLGRLSAEIENCRVEIQARIEPDRVAATARDVLEVERTENRAWLDRYDALDSRYGELSRDLGESRQVITSGLSHLERQLAEARLALEYQNFELQNAVAHATGRTDGTAIEAANAIVEVRNAVLHATSQVDGIGFKTANAIAEVQNAVAHASSRIDGIGRETTNAIAELRNAVLHATSRIDGVGFETANAIAEVQNAVAHASSRIDGIGFETANAIAEVQNAVVHASSRIDGIGFETSNALSEMRFLSENRHLDLRQDIFELRNATQHLGSVIENVEVRLSNNIGERFSEVTVENIGRLLRIEGRLLGARLRCRSAPPTLPSPITDLGFDEAVDRARSDCPRQFDDWFSRLKTLEDAIAVTTVGNLAHAADPYSRAFKSFVNVHASGTVLDVGCGTMGRPIYLADLPAERLHGIEPLSLQAPFDFPVRRGIGEYLPWEDGSFDTVVSATAIDHSLSLDRTLNELRRVLAPSGRLLMWVGSNSGTRPFDPNAPDYVPADRFHLFHIDRAWFEPMLERRFTIEDRVVLWTPSHEHVFYKLHVLEGPSHA